MRNAQQTIEYYDTRIKSQEKYLQEKKRELDYCFVEEERKKIDKAILLFERQIKSLERDKADYLYTINEDKELKIENKLLSINLVLIEDL